MILKFCDGCGTNIERGNNVSYLCHIDDIVDGNIAMGYVDGDGNMISGRQVNVVLCNSCYNKVLVRAVQQLRELQKANQNRLNKIANHILDV